MHKIDTWLRKFRLWQITALRVLILIVVVFVVLGVVWITKIPKAKPAHLQSNGSSYNLDLNSKDTEPMTASAMCSNLQAAAGSEQNSLNGSYNIDVSYINKQIDGYYDGTTESTVVEINQYIGNSNSALLQVYRSLIATDNTDRAKYQCLFSNTAEPVLPQFAPPTRWFP